MTEVRSTLGRRVILRMIRPTLIGLLVFCTGCVTDKTFFTTSNPVFMQKKYAGDPQPNLYWQESCRERKKNLNPEICGNYHLAIVELDDWGQLREPSQLDDARFMIETVRKKLLADLPRQEIQKDAITLVFFTHGWKHYANTILCEGEDGREPEPKNCRSDLERFRIFLKKLSEKRGGSSEDKVSRTFRQEALDHLDRSHVVGIFLTWRGAPVRRDNRFLRMIGAVPNFFSFWTRDRVAERIGGQGAAYLDAVYDLSNLARKRMDIQYEIEQKELEERVRKVVQPHDSATEGLKSAVVLPKISVIAIGHSFGGKITELGLGPSLLSGTKGRSAYASVAYAEVERHQSRQKEHQRLAQDAADDARRWQAKLDTVMGEIEDLKSRLEAQESDSDNRQTPMPEESLNDMEQQVLGAQGALELLRQPLPDLEFKQGQASRRLAEPLELFSSKLAELEEQLEFLQVVEPATGGVSCLLEVGNPELLDCFETRLTGLCDRLIDATVRRALGSPCSGRETVADVSPLPDQITDLEGRRHDLELASKDSFAAAQVLRDATHDLNAQRDLVRLAKENLKGLEKQHSEIEKRAEEWQERQRQARDLKDRREAKIAESKKLTGQVEAARGTEKEERRKATEAGYMANRLIDDVLPNPFDLVLLINPAAPAIRALELRTGFHEVDKDLQNRRDNAHKPMIVAISSSEDWATKTVFPVAKRIGIGAKHLGMTKKRRRALTRTAPHVSEWVDFRLQLCSDEDRNRAPCRPAACPNEEGELSESCPLFIAKKKDNTLLEYRLTPLRQEVGPYWVIDEQAALIDGHSDALSTDMMQIMIGLLGKAHAFNPPKDKFQTADDQSDVSSNPKEESDAVLTSSMD